MALIQLDFVMLSLMTVFPLTELVYGEGGLNHLQITSQISIFILELILMTVFPLTELVLCRIL